MDGTEPRDHRTEFGGEFLSNPDLFPARASGESWGDEEVWLDLPGGPYRFSRLSQSQKRAVDEKMSEFLIDRPTSKRAVESLVFRVPPGDFLPFEKKGWEYSLDFDYQPSSVRMVGLDFMGRLDWRPELSGSFWTPVDDAERFRGAFENYFRVLTSYSLLEQRGVLIHSAGVVSGGGAYIFMGRSGSGKTTLSRLSLDAGRSVMSDDLNALRMTESGPVAVKLPFAGELGSTSAARGSYPLKALCRMEKGDAHRIRPLSRAAAVASLAACSPNVNHNPYEQDRLLGHLELLVGAVPTYVVTFSRDGGGLWDLFGKNS